MDSVCVYSDVDASHKFSVGSIQFFVSTMVPVYMIGFERTAKILESLSVSVLLEKLGMNVARNYSEV